MADIVNTIAGNPWYVLISIIGTIGGVVGLMLAILRFTWRMFYRQLPTRTKAPQEQPSDDAHRVKLKLWHRLKPSKYPLKGQRVIATGTIWKLEYRDKEVPFIELHAFPHNIDVEVICEFAKEYATDLHAIDQFRFVSVVGTAADNLEIADSGRGHGCRLRLTNCEVERAGFWDWLRYEWNLMRPWWFV